MTKPSWELPPAAVGSDQQWTAAARFASAHCSWTRTAPNPANKIWPQKVKMDTLNQATTLWPAQLFLQTHPLKEGKTTQKSVRPVHVCFLKTLLISLEIWSTLQFTVLKF